MINTNVAQTMEEESDKQSRIARSRVDLAWDIICKEHGVPCEYWRRSDDQFERMHPFVTDWLANDLEYQKAMVYVNRSLPILLNKMKQESEEQKTKDQVWWRSQHKDK